ncbi:MAG: Nuclear actin-protein involved in chromatin remodeling [Sclerophora amabilis]|nr:MAG: Nuclear actin-protein involved in chromatin remodeling [Sclerophora amabilis]
MVESTKDSSKAALEPSGEPPLRIWTVQDPPFESSKPPEPDGYEQSERIGADSSAIVIDSGSSTIRAGWSFDKTPRLAFPPIVSRYRDRKYSRTFALVGSDAYADATTRGQIRSAFEAGTGIVSNWDVMEGILDSIFLKLGVEGDSGGVGRNIVMTEQVANLGYSRKTMTEIIFECYSAPSLTYGIDSLFSYDYNEGRTGLVISSSHSSTHLIPVIDKKPMLSHATRINWGGLHNAEYLQKLLQLKYPNFPGKISSLQAEKLVREHCYISREFQTELAGYLEWTGLEERDHTIQYPFTEQVVVPKTEEELARIVEKRKEGGRRLQEQAAKMRLEKLIKKEQELEYYRDLQQKAATVTKKEFRRLLESNDFETEAQLEKVVKELDKSIRKARTKDVGGADEEGEEEIVTFPLLDVPDEELDEAGIRQKRHQRLMKSNHEARARAKAEKAKEKERVAEEERLDLERRENDLEGWLEERRNNREVTFLFSVSKSLLQRIKDRQRLKADLSNRKSLASQMRMKSIANLASDSPSSTKKRRRGGGGADDDTFGANDDDWGVYRKIATQGEGGGGDGSDDEDEDLSTSLRNLEAQLLEYDPDFTHQNTLDAQSDWKKSLLHAFVHGPRAYDADSTREAHQIHLNVERIRVPEVVFEPAIAGVDQAGVLEIATEMLTQRLPASRDELLKDVFLTGGNTLFQGFEDRLTNELRAVLPAGAPLRLRKAADAVRDPWRGAARWVSSSGADITTIPWKTARVTRAEYLEKGADYMKVSHRPPFLPKTSP